MRRPGEHVGLLDVDALFIFPENAGVEFANFLEGLAFGQGGHNHLVAAGLGQLLPHMAHVGDVLDVIDLVAVYFQDAANPVGHQVGAQVADVSVAVHRRPAGVHRTPCRASWDGFPQRTWSGYCKYAALHTSRQRDTSRQRLTAASVARAASDCIRTASRKDSKSARGEWSSAANPGAVKRLSGHVLYGVLGRARGSFQHPRFRRPISRGYRRACQCAGQRRGDCPRRERG